MSILLDALRRGRGRSRKTPEAGSAAVRADAVLHTLGQRRPRPRPVDRVGRFVAFVAGALAFAIVLWGVAIWIRQGM